MRADNSIHLTTAARRRHEHTRAKAIAAMHELDRAGAVLTFESVARHAGVSRSWIYTQTDIKDEIRRLRDLNRRRTEHTHTLPGNAPATTPCDSASKSPTAATANSPTRTSGYAANSPAPLANSATTVDPDLPRTGTSQFGNNRYRADRRPASISPLHRRHPPRRKRHVTAHISSQRSR